MARRISISEELYGQLSNIKGKRSITAVIKGAIGMEEKNDIMKFFGILKSESKKLNRFQKLINEEREKNYGRKFD